jgi:hypothetical protein
VTDVLTQGRKPERPTGRTSGIRVPPAGRRPLVAGTAVLKWVWRTDAAPRMPGSTRRALEGAAGFRMNRRSIGWSQVIRQCPPQHLAV